MKKITLLAVAFVAISFASCKKTYTCDCGGISVTSGSKLTKSQADAWCVSPCTLK